MLSSGGELRLRLKRSRLLTNVSQDTKTAGRPKKARTPKADSLPAPPAPETAKIPTGKLGAIAVLMQRQGGATIAEMMQATGWQAHSVRGAIAGALKRTFKLQILSSKAQGDERRYTIVQATLDQG